MRFVPVVSLENKPLMPTIPSRARKWIKSGKATPFFKKGIFCVRLNEKTNEITESIVIGLDTGKMKDGFTIKSFSHTYLNIQVDSINYISKYLERKKFLRKHRRFRKTPYRKCRWNRSSRLKSGRIRPSVKARYDLKLKLISSIKSIFPITNIIVEDVKAILRRGKENLDWNTSFAPLQHGKNWFYKQLPNLTLKRGYETKKMRLSLGLDKNFDKLSNDFHSHCVDSWVLANSIVGGDKVDNKSILLISPIVVRRRQLFAMQTLKNGKRQRYGGTISIGFKKGSIIKHQKYNYCYVGGYKDKNNLQICSLSTGKRGSDKIKVKDCKFICYNSIKYQYIN